ncbi:hypothetical protein GCM10010885_15400 [Alicyclobacillus cellulosilyticus]|uniref:YaaC-like protein n=1 Tax=Alicyclobacillus cellulosilyticus TaxID=1003997 RepID=A0A917KAS7_9BACL|nr:YaaC family protein [Alicyclobacillus cellulosilyticus]GGJ07162.1 hypothetical protein GCM10010885_15400 [Alicyclobacillus cellulosilyticus]
MTAWSMESLQSEAVALQVVRAWHPDAPSGLQYHASTHLAATVRLAMAFEREGKAVALELKPLAMYYALLNWLKAAIHLQEVSYPRSAHVMQHGVSVRRTKRANYRWPYDVLWLHREGVLQSFRDAFCPGLELPLRCRVGELLASLPNLAVLLPPWYTSFQALPWRSRLASRLAENNHPQDDTSIPGTQPANRISAHRISPEEANNTQDVALTLIHFGLLYSLSALARYHPVEWSDIVHWNNDIDAALVRQYVSYVAEWRPPVLHRLLQF